MKELIRGAALGLGFDDCRFTTAEPADSASSFAEWLASQRHGTMEYMARSQEKRADPRLVLPGARSVISLAASYARPGDTISSRSDPSLPLTNREDDGGIAPRHSSAAGVVARYARFKDYHAVVGERLGSLANFVDATGGNGTRSVWYVDTGPVLERALAQRAGVGFFGKHTNLISRRLGNWIFLAEILTTLELEPDQPEINRCGTCDRCIKACPTEAIIGPFRLDARRCISYLTIELKGPIPEELRPAIGKRIFGCDDCLAVCPWNRFAREGKLMRENANSKLEAPDLLELLALDQPAFKRRFAGTPMERTKRKGLLRNVCVALGNCGDRHALPALERAAHDPEPLIAEHARWAVKRLEGQNRS